MKITSTLNDLTPQLLQGNLKRSKRQLSRYHHDEWTVAEEISKSLVPKLKNFKMEATQVIKAYYKVAEISRTHGCGATELFEQLVSIKEGDLSVEQKNQLFDEALRMVGVSQFSPGHKQGNNMTMQQHMCQKPSVYPKISNIWKDRKILN